MITKEQIKKAVSMHESKLSWAVIGEVVGVDPEELRTECEKSVRRPLPDRAMPAGTRVVDGFVILKKEVPENIRGQRVTYVSRLADAVVAGDCVQGILSQGAVSGLRERVAKRGLVVRGVKRPGEKVWDVYISTKKKP